MPSICSKRLFSDHSYALSFPGPSLTTLTLVDLPGAHFANDDQRMNHVTQQLVLEYIKKNTKSIIVIVSEVGDPTGDSAINLVMTQAQDFRTRTICVLTKPDKLRMEDDMGKKVALNQSSFTLEDGRFIVLRGMIWGNNMLSTTTRWVEFQEFVSYASSNVFKYYMLTHWHMLNILSDVSYAGVVL
mgnify:CR=1 FL=1